MVPALGTGHLYHAAVGEELHAGDEARRIAGEEYRRLADLSRVGEPSERIAFAHRLHRSVDLRGSGRGLERAAERWCVDSAGGQDVDPNARSLDVLNPTS